MKNGLWLQLYSNALTFINSKIYYIDLYNYGLHIKNFQIPNRNDTIEVFFSRKNISEVIRDLTAYILASEEDVLLEDVLLEDLLIFRRPFNRSDPI